MNVGLRKDSVKVICFLCDLCLNTERYFWFWRLGWSVYPSLFWHMENIVPFYIVNEAGLLRVCVEFEFQSHPRLRAEVMGFEPM